MGKGDSLALVPTGNIFIGTDGPTPDAKRYKSFVLAQDAVHNICDTTLQQCPSMRTALIVLTVWLPERADIGWWIWQQEGTHHLTHL